MTPAARARAFDALVVDPDILFFKMREASAEEIDEKGVYNILLQLHGECIQAGLAAAKVSSEAIAIVDGTLNIPGAHCLPKADALVPAVSAASILAKVIRDRAMIDADELYPGYGFAKHKGYGVPQHQAALERLGPCALHRRSYEPVAKIIREQIVDEPVTSWEVLIKEDPL
jgi:ribonuclease HII